VGSLILIPPTDQPVGFLAFFRGVGLVVAFHLPTRVFRVLDPVEGTHIDSSPGGRAETGMAGIRMSLWKPGTGEMKLSKAWIQTKET
jgi:hypothetical protein